MNTRSCTRIVGLMLVAIMAGCGGGGGGSNTPPPPPPPPPPPAANASPAGIWVGQAVSSAAADVFTSFEFNATGGFLDGTPPYAASYSNGDAVTRGVPAFYISGVNAWHILLGTIATVTFETPPNTLTFHVRTENAGDVSNIDILDQNDMLILNVVPTNVYQTITLTGVTLIASIEVTSTSGGDVVIDDLTFGYSGSGFAGGTDDIGCVVSEMMELVCVIRNVATDAILSTAEAILQVTNTSDVSATGTLYSAPGLMLADGNSAAPLTITAGTITEGTTLDLTVDVAGSTNVVSMAFDATYNRGSDLATVEAVYTSFDIFGDMSSFTIDAAGIITGQSASGCVLNGAVSLIDANFNAYDVQLDASVCGGLDGMYDGLGVTQDEAGTDDAFVFAVTNALDAIAGVAIK